MFFEPAQEGGFVVICPALPGLVTEGDSLEDVRAMAADAIRGYLESLSRMVCHFPRMIRTPARACAEKP